MRLGVSWADTSEMPVMLPPARQAVDQPGADRVAGRKHHHRELASLLGDMRGGIADGDDDIDLACHQFIEQARQTVELSLRTASLNHEIAALRIALLGKGANERRTVWACVDDWRRGAEQADPISLRWRLAEGSTRPYGRREGDELATTQLIDAH
jgi:hypothetical protein